MSYFLNRQFGDPLVQFGEPGRGKFGEPTNEAGVVEQTFTTEMECLVNLTLEVYIDAQLQESECIAAAEIVDGTINIVRTVRALDKNGDIVTRGVQFLNGRDDIAQTIKTRLALYKGEYFRNTAEGTPWFQDILGKNSNLNRVEALLRTRIAATPGVIRLTSFSMDYDLATRKLTVTASALTRFGLAEIEFNG